MIEHHLVRSVVIPEIVAQLCIYYAIDEEEALDRFYRSTTGSCYADDSTGLYGQPALHVACLFITECDGEVDTSRLPAGPVTWPKVSSLQ